MSAALMASNEGIVIAELNDFNTPIIFANPAFLQLTGYTCEEILHQECLFLMPLTDDEERKRIHDTLQKRLECSERLRLEGKGRSFYVDFSFRYTEKDGRYSHIICFYKDVTQEEYLKSVLDKVNILYREMSKRLEYTNETDNLTKLKNRGHLSTRGEFLLGAAKREKLRLHAILVDINCFKMLNTIGGATLGDECLIKVADIIRRYFSRSADIAIRMCDDEFVIVCIEDDDQRVYDRVESLRKEVNELKMKDVMGREHDVSVSIGIYSVTPEKSTTIEEMIHNAGQLVFRHNQAPDGQVIHDKLDGHARPFRH